jgi:hypothetical protein
VLHGSERQFFPRSEVPAPVPDSVTRQDLPAAFDTLPRAYRALQSMLNAAMAQSGRVGTELADYLKASPELAHWLSRWRAQS